MAGFEVNSDWVDRYIRDELNEAEQEAFELALMDSHELQLELEAAMGVRAAVELEDEQEAPNEGARDIMGQTSGQWRTLAMAASVTLAIFSTVMYWRTGTQVTDLESELESLSQPVGNVLRVPVDIMRSAGNQQPDVIVQKPADDAMIVLDIEISPRVQDESELIMKLIDDEGNVVLSWSSQPPPSGRASMAVRSFMIPAGLLTLEASNALGEVLDRRLIEFR